MHAIIVVFIIFFLTRHPYAIFAIFAISVVQPKEEVGPEGICRMYTDVNSAPIHSRYRSFLLYHLFKVIRTIMKDSI